MYSPKIREDLIRKLYLIGKSTRQPMTKVVDHILRQALDGSAVDHGHLVLNYKPDKEDGFLLRQKGQGNGRSDR